jgi:hypothetical protein
MPCTIELLAGVIATDTNTAAVTPNPVEPLIDPELAWIVVLPTPTPVVKPVPVIVATPVLLELQVTEVVRFTVLPSLYVPVAVNCCVNPRAIVGFAGVTAIDTSAVVTVRLAAPLMEPEVACIVVLPLATALATPAALIVATAMFVELHVTELVRLDVLPSLYVPVAV